MPEVRNRCSTSSQHLQFGGRVEECSGLRVFRNRMLFEIIQLFGFVFEKGVFWERVALWPSLRVRIASLGRPKVYNINTGQEPARFGGSARSAGA
jgi:hypothetical protein